MPRPEVPLNAYRVLVRGGFCQQGKLYHQGTLVFPRPGRTTAQHCRIVDAARGTDTRVACFQVRRGSPGRLQETHPPMDGRLCVCVGFLNLLSVCLFRPACCSYLRLALAVASSHTDGVLDCTSVHPRSVLAERTRRLRETTRCIDHHRGRTYARAERQERDEVVGVNLASPHVAAWLWLAGRRAGDGLE
jgi:hypothetical protein